MKVLKKIVAWLITLACVFAIVYPLSIVLLKGKNNAVDYCRSQQAWTVPVHMEFEFLCISDSQIVEVFMNKREEVEKTVVFTKKQ